MEELLLANRHLYMGVLTVIFVLIWCFVTHRFWWFRKKHPEVFQPDTPDESKSAEESRERFMPADNPLYQTVKKTADEDQNELQKLQKILLRHQYDQNLLTSQFIIVLWELSMFVPLIDAESRWFLLTLFIFIVCVYVIARLQR